MIKSLYRGPNGDLYFQKSRVFLYPVLETKRVGTVTPINTYVSWEGYTTREDRKLVCLFYLRNDSEYKKFEKVALIGNELFCDFREITPIDNKSVGVYLFDYSKYAVDWDVFLKGRYSSLKAPVKERIRRHYNGNNANSVYVDSFVYPKKYYEIYSRILGVPVSHLRGGELCDKPDFDKEHLKMSEKDVQITDKSINLPKL